MQIVLNEKITGFKFLSKSPDGVSLHYRKTLRDDVFCDLTIISKYKNHEFDVCFEILEIVKIQNRTFPLNKHEPMTYKGQRIVTNDSVGELYAEYIKDFEKNDPLN